ncbi:MAG: hypothetical protein V3U39_04870 [Acidimicrobiia bacterium]
MNECHEGVPRPGLLSQLLDVIVLNITGACGADNQRLGRDVMSLFR